MPIPVWQVDAFTNRRFAGNPAAVVSLEQWLPDEQLLQIAAENNLSETAFVRRERGQWHIRWFTPKVEVSLCGHATLASAHVIFSHLQPSSAAVSFQSKSGVLTVTRTDGKLVLDFPAYASEKIETPELLVRALGAKPVETWLGKKMMALFDTEAEVALLTPDFSQLVKLDCQGVIATATGTTSDIASRYFAPQFGIDEDPVTGAAHCQLTPFWCRRLGKETLHARQISDRGGEMWCTFRGDRVALAGQAIEYLRGTIEV